MGYRQQKVKKEHSILAQGKPLLEEIAKAPGVTRVIPGRIKAGHASRGLYCTLQYRTEAGFKLLMHTGSTQEVFVVSDRPDETEAWLREHLPQQRPE